MTRPSMKCPVRSCVSIAASTRPTRAALGEHLGASSSAFGAALSARRGWFSTANNRPVHGSPLRSCSPIVSLVAYWRTLETSRDERGVTL